MPEPDNDPTKAFDWSSSAFEDVWMVRRQLWKSGYSPLAVYGPKEKVNAPGKQPVGKGWQERPNGSEPNAVTEPPAANALNTGILCDGLRAIDIDIDCVETVDKVISLARSILGGAPVRYRNDSPRRLMLYRASTGEPRKLVISGRRGKVEVLGRGQQFVAFGIHPDGSPYEWEPREFAAYECSQLTQVMEEAVDEFLKAVAPVIEASYAVTNVVGRTLASDPHIHADTLPTAHERAYANKALADNVAELSSRLAGSGRNTALNGIAYRMGRMVGAGWIEQETVEAALRDASRRNGYESKDGFDAVAKTLRSGLSRGITEPNMPLPNNNVLECVREFAEQGRREQFDELSHKPNVAAPLKPANAFQNSVGLVIHRVSDVEAQPIQWLWYQRIALGKVTLIAGDPGLGKSQLTAFLAAMVSTGGSWPNSDGVSPSGSVIMLSCEDDVADTIRPRLEAVGADLKRVHVIEAVKTGEGKSRGFDITADLAKLEEEMKRIPNVRLVTVDPITAYLGGTDTHRTSDVRAALGPLQVLAAQYGVAVVAVSHLNKAGGVGKSVNAVTGSGAFVAAARASFLVVKDEADEDRRLLIESKNNLGHAPGLSYRINQRTLVGGIVAPFVEFEPGTVNKTADEALGASISSNEGVAIREAMQFLWTELASAEVPTKEILKLALEAGIAARTLRRAADNIGVMKVKGAFKGGWAWRLPEPSKVAKNFEDGHAENMDTFANLWPSSTAKQGEE
jgi:putative DNA primase/helicase